MCFGFSLPNRTRSVRRPTQQLRCLRARSSFVFLRALAPRLSVSASRSLFRVSLTLRFLCALCVSALKPSVSVP
jgi:hypothetical protein